MSNDVFGHLVERALLADRATRLRPPPDALFSYRPGPARPDDDGPGGPARQPLVRVLAQEPTSAGTPAGTGTRLAPSPVVRPVPARTDVQAGGPARRDPAAPQPHIAPDETAGAAAGAARGLSAMTPGLEPRPHPGPPGPRATPVRVAAAPTGDHSSLARASRADDQPLSVVASVRPSGSPAAPRSASRHGQDAVRPRPRPAEAAPSRSSRVEITIDRVDVHVERPTAPPPRATERPPAGLSLRDYLARRERS